MIAQATLTTLRKLGLKPSPLPWEPLVAVLILLGAARDWASLPKPDDAAAYHRSVREAAARIPLRIGDWIGRDVPVPRAAVVMLHPNVIVSRQYVNAASGVQATLLLVQCGDARDIVAHYPPVCYVNSGWTMTAADPRDWLISGIRLTGTEYRFDMRSFEKSGAIAVSNFILLPDGRIVRDMDAVAAAAGDVTRRYFGAAQVQVLTAAELPVEKRDAAVADLVGAMQQTIAAIRAGGAR